jgi:uncharacterized protein Veg
MSHYMSHIRLKGVTYSTENITRVTDSTEYITRVTYTFCDIYGLTVLI